MQDSSKVVLSSETSLLIEFILQFNNTLNEKILYPSYQPIKKIISYNFDKPLKKGSHKIEFKVRDRMNNESSETIYFSII